MQRLLTLSLTIWSTAALLQQPLYAKVSVPYSTSSVQGSTIITNYYDPNAGPNVGPGLTPTPLQNRFDAPLGTLSPTSSYSTSGYAAPIYSSTGLSTSPQVVPQTQTYQQPLYTPQTHQQTGPVILNPIPKGNAQPPPSHYEDPTYPNPGLVTLMNGKWIGSSYLYDMPSDIGIVFEVVRPGGKPVNVNTDELRKQASELFINSHFHPESLAIGNDPPLPFFHILIYVYPDEERYTAAILGRLFEKVKVSRLDYNLPGTSQAITWEKLDLIITSPLQFNDQLAEAVREIVRSFLNQVHYFDVQKLKQESGFKLQANLPKKIRPKNEPFKFDRSSCR